MKQISLLFLLTSLFAQTPMVAEKACLDCHVSGSWFPLLENPIFNHTVDTEFLLEGTHKDLRCTQCHEGNTIDAFHTFQAKGMDCVACHQDVHQNYWGNDCERCHSPENWDPTQAYKRHNETLFPLLAAHHTNECGLCHTVPGMTPSLECQDCHSSDFLPGLSSHGGVSDQTDCSICHAPTRWNQILAINHGVFFPIYSGNHRGVWDNCSTCHTRSNNYEYFSCTGCHSVSRMNSEHCEGGGCESCDGLTYPRSGLTSEDCYFCHPAGNTSKCGD